MPLQRLRRVLNAQFQVNIDSSADTVRRVQMKIQERAAAYAAKRKQPPDTKTPAVVPALVAIRNVVVRPIDLLRTIGDLTTPTQVNLASLSASWATRRYFWAIADPRGPNPQFHLSQDAREMDFHQKTLLSDEFGIGFGGLMLQVLFNAGRSVDVSEALDDPQAYQNPQKLGATQPDYLMWDDAPNSPYYVVECKGCQTQRQATINQIRRGMEQVRSLEFATGARSVSTLVVATHLQASKTTVYIIDPPDDQPKDDRHKPIESFSERTGKRSYRIHRPEEFARAARITRQLKLLNWAGQFGSAEGLASRERRARRQPLNLPNTAPIRETIRGMEFEGRRVPLFPEIGGANLHIFTGVREDVLAAAREGIEYVGGQADAEARGLDDPTGAHDDPAVSFGRDGTCLVIEGL